MARRQVAPCRAAPDPAEAVAHRKQAVLVAERAADPDRLRVLPKRPAQRKSRDLREAHNEPFVASPE